MDGRIRELLANGTSVWNEQFYSPSINPNITSNSSMNNSVHLKVQVWTNGSYILNWIDGTSESFMDESSWPKVYFYRKAEFARQIKTLEEFDDGSKSI